MGVRVGVVPYEYPPQAVGSEPEIGLELVLAEPALDLVEPVPAVFQLLVGRFGLDQEPRGVHALDVPERDRVVGLLAAFGRKVAGFGPIIVVAERIQQWFDHPVLCQRLRVQSVPSEVRPHRVPARLGPEHFVERVVVDLVAEAADAVSDRFDKSRLVGVGHRRLELGHVERRLCTLGGHR